MTIHVAIHDNPRPDNFSSRWLAYCEENRIRYSRVSCYDCDIIKKLSNANALLWNWVHFIPADVLLARGLVRAVEEMGLLVFPNSSTCWHYDDKIVQKYLLEAIDAPIVPTQIFYDPADALRWIESAQFPKVFKLSKGAASANVRLVRSAKEAKGLLKKAFWQGFAPAATPARLLSKPTATLAHVRRKGYAHLLKSAARLPRLIRDLRRKELLAGRENGYLYLQEFLPGNKFDTRITVIGNRAFGFTRNVRENDFRASGSGSISYDLSRIDLRAVAIAFKVARRLQAQSIAFDFLKDANDELKIAEISYCYQDKAVYDCEGHWDEQMNWKNGHLWPQDAILIDLLKQLQIG